MEHRFIARRNVPVLLDALLARYSVIAPVERNGTVLLDTIGSGAEATLDYTVSATSPKEAVMPRLETLLSAGSGPDQSVVEHIGVPRPLLLFGSRPCDARGFSFLDRVFILGSEPDIYYRNRRDSLLIVTLACLEPRSTCFCSSTGGDPSSTQGSDVLLVEQDEGYVVHPVTEKGTGFLNDPAFKEVLGHSPAGEVRPAPRAAIDPPVDPALLKERLDGSYDSEAWLALTRKCISCGVCTYVCPTCHCFDIVDEEVPGVKVRNRVWDSCQFPCFTEQASGHNPRPTCRERYRQRVMHKFSYSPDNNGMAGCVGCGRCVLHCPVGLDIRQVMLAFHGSGEE